MLCLALIICATIYASNGMYTSIVTGVLGFLFGASLTDLRYSDFLTFRVSCDER